jgi:hypothetical protein
MKTSLLYFPNFYYVIDRTHQIHLKTPCCDSWDIEGQSLSRNFKALSCTTLLPGLDACICLATFLQLIFVLGAIFWEFNFTPITELVIKILKEYCAWFCQAVWSNLFFLLLSCVVNLFSKSASQGEGCCIIMRDQYLSWGSTVALNCFLTQKSVSRMGRGRKRHQTSKKSTDENDHSQTGQCEEIATPPVWRTSPRRGRPEEFTEMNSSNPLQTEEPGIGNNSYYAASPICPNANHQDKTSSLFAIDRIAEPLPNAAQTLEDLWQLKLGLP